MPDYNTEALINNAVSFILSPSAPNALVRVCVGLFVVAACFMFLPVKRAFFEQCAAAFLFEPRSVAINGVGTYAMFVLIVFIFLLSVPGFPFVVFFVLCGAFACILGEIAVAIWIGNFFTDTLNIAKNAYSNLAFGVIIIETLKLLPYAGYVLAFGVMPVLAFGALATGVYNGLVKHVLYELPYWREYNG